MEKSIIIIVFCSRALRKSYVVLFIRKEKKSYKKKEPSINEASKPTEIKMID